MLRVSLLDDLLRDFLNEVQDLLGVLIVDSDGLIIAQQSVEGFDEEIVGAIMSIIDQTINELKEFTKISYGSGTFNTNDFRIFYIELGILTPALFVLVADPYSDIEEFIPYSYIVADKVSLILNNRDTSLNIPKFNNMGEMVLNSESKPFSGKNIIYKIAIIGNEKVGKSSLVEMYLKGKIENLEYRPTIGISINEKELQIAKNIKLTIFTLDMSGSRSFTKVRKSYYHGSNAVLIIFDYTNIVALENITKWLEEAQNYIKDVSIPYLLIGNKIDLADNRENVKNEAEQLANQHNCSFFETSASTGEGIDEIFTYLLNLIH